MKFIKNFGLPLFIVMLFLHLLSINAGWDGIRLVSKLLLIPILLLYLFANSYPLNQFPLGKLPFIALFFSFLGDLFLSQSGTMFFLLGMLSFMLTHIFNSICFLQMQKIEKITKLSLLIALVVFVTATVGVYHVIAPSLGSFQLPILIYMGLIGTMGLLAVNLSTNEFNRRIAQQYFIPGAGLFILSDSLLALNKFHFQEPAFWDMPVMLTYGLAQLLIVLGYAKWQGRGTD
jgi:uncharacterized membrane protein YhhN